MKGSLPLGEKEKPEEWIVKRMKGGMEGGMEREEWPFSANCDLAILRLKGEKRRWLLLFGLQFDFLTAASIFSYFWKIVERNRKKEAIFSKGEEGLQCFRGMDF